MNDTQGLTFCRLSGPDEDGLIRVEVRARNECFAATGEGYTNARQLHSFADALTTFPERLPAATAFSAKCGHCEISLLVETLDGSGHVGLKVSIEEDLTPQSNLATFWLKAEPNSLVDLARQLRLVADLSSEKAELLS